MPEEQKISAAETAIVAGVVVFGTLITLAILASRAAPPPVYTCPHCGATFDTEEELLAHIELEHPEVLAEGATIRIEVFDAEGQPVTSSSPVELTEGESYTVVVTVTNASTKAGVPWDVTFELVIQAATAYTTLIPVTADMEGFAAGQTRSFSFPMSVPLGSGGETGQIIALVNDPGGAEIVRATEPLTIITIEIIYGATVTIGT